MSDELPPVVPPLTMTTEDGKAYTRSIEVEVQIAETLGWTDAELMGRRKSLYNEALVHNIRRFSKNQDVSGLLISELVQRTLRIVKAAIRGLDRLGKDDIAMQIEMEIVELVIAPEASRKSEFLEVAFTEAVRRRAINLREKLKGTVEGNRGRYKTNPILDLDEQDKKRKRPLEFAPDSRNSPEAALAAFQDEQFQGQAYEIVLGALDGEDERLMLAFRLHVVDGWPIWSEDPSVPTVARHFKLTRGQAKYLLEKTRQIIADVLTAYSAGKKTAGKKTAVAGVQK